MSRTHVTHRAPQRWGMRRTTPYFLVAPAVLLVSAVVLVPIAQSVWYSLHGGTIVQTGGFIGLQNYVEMLAHDRFQLALRNTVVFTIATVCAELVLGTALAFLLHRAIRGLGLIRAVALVPWAFPTAISAVMFRLMFSDDTGVLTWLATSVGLVHGTVLGDEANLLVATIVVDIWKTTPFVALLVLAGLQTIPEEVGEAAVVDGAGRWQRFVHVTLPLLMPSVLIAALFKTLDSFRHYDLFWVMGKREVNSLATYIYESVRVTQLQFGNGSAASVFIFVVSFLIALLFVILLGLRQRKVS